MAYKYIDNDSFEYVSEEIENIGLNPNNIEGFLILNSNDY